MVKLSIITGDKRLDVVITEGRGSGVFRDTSADTTLDFDRIPLDQIGQLCSGMFECFREPDGQ